MKAKSIDKLIKIIATSGIGEGIANVETNVRNRTGYIGRIRYSDFYEECEITLHESAFGYIPIYEWVRIDNIIKDAIKNLQSELPDDIEYEINPMANKISFTYQQST